MWATCWLTNCITICDTGGFKTRELKALLQSQLKMMTDMSPQLVCTQLHTGKHVRHKRRRIEWWQDQSAVASWDFIISSALAKTKGAITLLNSGFTKKITLWKSNKQDFVICLWSETWNHRCQFYLRAGSGVWLICELFYTLPDRMADISRR